MKHRFPAAIDILVFDMDGVLIDVSESYRKVITETVEIYLHTCLGFKRESIPPIPQKVIASLKMVGGFNNDWDVTSGLLLFLVSLSTLPPLSRRKSFPSIQETLTYLQRRSSRFTPSFKAQNLSGPLSLFLGEVASYGGGLKGMQRALGKNENAAWKGWVYHTGEIDSTNVVKRIFQEIYLGQNFARCYSLQPLFYRGPGYYLQEKLLIPRRTLAALQKRLRLGIASGRPRFEAELALRRFRISQYFDRIVTLDECVAEEKRLFRITRRKVKRTKPHPYSLLRVIREMSISHPRCAYVGDTVDDMEAARRANRESPVVPIGFISRATESKSHVKSLKKAGARFVIQRPADLLKLLS